MKVTLDTNFLVSANQWYDSVARKLLRTMIEANVQLFTTKEIMSEFFRVLQRDFYLDESQLNDVASYVLAFVTFVVPPQKVDIVKEDPDDNKIIECAVASDSEYIITYDKHLLKLKEYNGIRIVTPEEARELI